MPRIICVYLVAGNRTYYTRYAMQQKQRFHLSVYDVIQVYGLVYDVVPH